MENRSALMDFVCEFASRSYENMVLISDEYKEIRDEIIALQNEIESLDLTTEQKHSVQRLLKDNSDLYTEYAEKIYRQAMRDCVVFLKEIEVLQK